MSEQQRESCGWLLTNYAARSRELPPRIELAASHSALKDPDPECKTGRNTISQSARPDREESRSDIIA